MSFLETERLILRPWTPDDAEAAFAIYGDPEVTRYLGGGGKPQESVQSQRETLERIIARHRELGWTDQGFGFWPCIEKATGTMVGAVLLLPLRDGEGQPLPETEIGWHFGRFAWGHGYATEAARALMDYGFTRLGLDRIFAVVYPENLASQRVMHRLGMTSKGVTSKYYGLELLLFEKLQP
jgi:RimJ/RimL family protein N-acetyltransferase